MAAALGLALAAHALLLFALDLPGPGRVMDRVRVTLTVDPGPHRLATDVGAAADQVGPDDESRRSRAAASTSGAADADASPAPGGRAGDDRSAVLARAAENAPASAAGRTQPAGSPVAAPDDGPTPESRTRTARADLRAAYLADWKRRVERAGSHNFPHAALEGGKRTRLTLEVTVRADGTLADTRVSQSSGNPALDGAAADILHGAAPFAPFPAGLRERHAQMTFAYVWRFVPGGESRLSVQ